MEVLFSLVFLFPRLKDQNNLLNLTYYMDLNYTRFLSNCAVSRKAFLYFLYFFFKVGKNLSVFMFINRNKTSIASHSFPFNLSQPTPQVLILLKALEDWLAW